MKCEPTLCKLQSHTFYLCVMVLECLFHIKTKQLSLTLVTRYLWNWRYVVAFLLYQYILNTRPKKEREKGNKIKRDFSNGHLIIVFSTSHVHYTGAFWLTGDTNIKCSVVCGNWSYFTLKWKTRLTKKNLVIKPLAKRKVRKRCRQASFQEMR
jgi:hypothetical protein